MPEVRFRHSILQAQSGAHTGINDIKMLVVACAHVLSQILPHSDAHITLGIELRLALFRQGDLLGPSAFPQAGLLVPPLMAIHHQRAAQYFLEHHADGQRGQIRHVYQVRRLPEILEIKLLFP